MQSTERAGPRSGHDQEASGVTIDDILRDSARAERASNIKLGGFLVLAGIAISVGMFVLMSGPGFQFFLIPSGVLGVGLFKLGRGLQGRSAD